MAIAPVVIDVMNADSVLSFPDFLGWQMMSQISIWQDEENYLLTNIADFAFVSTRTATVVVGDEISTITAILTRVLSTIIDIYLIHDRRHEN
jgi:hypothetical protein